MNSSNTGNQNIMPSDLAINQTLRAALLKQTPQCIWFTGLSGSGKTTLANALEVALHQAGRSTYTLDGDNVRHTLNADLGFSAADRAENIRRLGQVAKLMVDAGLIVLVSAISPFAADRAKARALFAKEQFVEVFVDTPLSVCESRDAKGLYARSRRGELKDFTGIDSPYEAPLHPELHLHGSTLNVNTAVVQLIQRLGAPQTL